MTLDDLIEHIREEAVHLLDGESIASAAGAQQVVISLLARVPVLVSSAVYSSRLAGGVAPVRVENALASGAGICGDHVNLAARVLTALDVPFRDLQIFYREGDLDLNHTVVEVRWHDAWHLVDVTWGFIPHRGSLDSALSFEEAARANHRSGLHHSMIPWRLAVEDKIDLFGYLTTEAEVVRFGDHAAGRRPAIGRPER